MSLGCGWLHVVHLVFFCGFPQTQPLPSLPAVSIQICHQTIPTIGDSLAMLPMSHYPSLVHIPPETRGRRRQNIIIVRSSIKATYLTIHRTFFHPRRSVQNTQACISQLIRADDPHLTTYRIICEEWAILALDAMNSMCRQTTNGLALWG